MEALASHDLRRQLGQRASDGFADEGYGAGGPGIDFKHVDHFVLHGILDIHQAADPQFTRHRLSVLPDGLKNLGRQGVGRQHHRSVTGMDTGKLDVLKNATDDDGALLGIGEVAHVSNAIDIDLSGVLQKLVHQHRPLGGGFHGEPHVVNQFCVRVDDLHGAATQDETRAHQHWVSEAMTGLQGFLGVDGQSVGGLRDLQLVQHGREELPVLGHLDALGRCANDIDAVFLKRHGEVQRGLAAELRDGAGAPFPLVYMQDVLEGQRFEEELVAGVVVGGDGLRVGVDHEGLEAVFLEGEGGVHAAIVELNALTYAVGATAEDHDLLLGRRCDLVIATVIGRVVIRGIGLELCGTGIDQPVAGHQSLFLALGTHVVLGSSGEMGDLAVGEAEGFGALQEFRFHRWTQNRGSKPESASGVESARDTVARERSGKWIEWGGPWCHGNDEAHGSRGVLRGLGPAGKGMMRHMGREEGLRGVGPAGKGMVGRVDRAGGSAGGGLRSQGTLQSEAFALRARGNRVFTFLCSLRPSPLPPSPS